jgi:capsid portal protein
MKYLITESQLDRIIFKYLDNQDFIQIKNGKTIYFVNSEGDEYGDSLIQYYRSGDCVISFELINEIQEFFSIEFDNSKYVIARWVENTLDKRVKEVIIR